MTGVLQRGRLQFTDSGGKPLAGGKVFVYVYGTTTLAGIYSDIAQTQPANTNPDGSVPLDANGTATMFGNGQFTLSVFDFLGNPVTGMNGPGLA